MGVYFFCEVTTAISIFFLRKIRKKRMLKSAAVCKEEGKKSSLKGWFTSVWAV